MDKLDKKSFLITITSIIAVFIFVEGITLTSYGVAGLIDYSDFAADIYSLKMIGGLFILASSVLYVLGHLKEGKTFKVVSALVDAVVILLLFIFGIIIVALHGAVTTATDIWVALVLVAINFALVDVANIKVAINDLKQAQQAVAAAAAKASIDEAEEVKKEVEKVEETKKEEAPVEPEVIEKDE